MNKVVNIRNNYFIKWLLSGFFFSCFFLFVFLLFLLLSRLRRTCEWFVLSVVYCYESLLLFDVKLLRTFLINVTDFRKFGTDVAISIPHNGFHELKLLNYYSIKKSNTIFAFRVKFPSYRVQTSLWIFPFFFSFLKLTRRKNVSVIADGKQIV